MGQKFDGLFCGPLLWTGVILLLFHSSGTVAVQIIQFAIQHSSCQMMGV